MCVCVRARACVRGHACTCLHVHMFTLVGLFVEKSGFIFIEISLHSHSNKLTYLHLR